MQKQGIAEFKASLVYWLSSGTAGSLLLLSKETLFPPLLQIKEMGEIHRELNA
jgi:hypothetical protein